uniref:MADS box regulatory protein n=1 Tax=Rumex acetosa TaxID=41241 RepID=Q42503_RUMAC|nr:MADS box regulatory protein [Rumex acetosa]CAA61481.1 MADS box regulatory protein [Rumex acetosa]
MTRGQIQIRRIENITNRQVTYSKRRNGLFKKAQELVVLCDAKVSIIMISSRNKLHEFTTPGTTTKQIYDMYQQLSGNDVWSSQYAMMLEELRKIKEANGNIRKEIRRRMGFSMEDMSFRELVILQQDMQDSVAKISERKYKAIANQIETTRKKLRNSHGIHRSLVHAFGALNLNEYGADPPTAAGSYLTTYTYLE